MRGFHLYRWRLVLLERIPKRHASLREMAARRYGSWLSPSFIQACVMCACACVCVCVWLLLMPACVFTPMFAMFVETHVFITPTNLESEKFPPQVLFTSLSVSLCVFIVYICLFFTPTLLARSLAPLKPPYLPISARAAPPHTAPHLLNTPPLHLSPRPKGSPYGRAHVCDSCESVPAFIASGS